MFPVIVFGAAPHISNILAQVEQLQTQVCELKHAAQPVIFDRIVSQSHAGATCGIPPVTKRTGIPTMLSWNQKVFFAAFHPPLCVRCCVLKEAGLQSLRESIWQSLFSLHRPLTLQWKHSAWDSAADSRVWFTDFTRHAQQATFASVKGYYVTLLDPYSSVICSAFFQKRPAFYRALSPSKPRCDHVRTLASTVQLLKCFLMQTATRQITLDQLNARTHADMMQAIKFGKRLFRRFLTWHGCWSEYFTKC